MRNREPNYQLLVLLSMLMIVAPLLVYPIQFGLPLLFVSLPILIGIEAIYSLFVWRFGFGITSNGALAARIGMTLAYRGGCAVLLALTFMVAYETEFVNALSLAGWNYLPALLIQSLAAPWVLGSIQPSAPMAKRDSQRIIIDGQRAELARPLPTDERANHGPLVTFTNAESREQTPRETSDSEMPWLSSIRSDRPKESPKPHPMPSTNWHQSSLNARPFGDLTGYDRATRYIGEHGSVLLACVVDFEGLVLSRYARGPIDAEEWAPMAIQLFDSSRDLLHKRGVSSPEKVDLTMNDKRVIAAREGEMVVLVIADRHGDETLPVRIHQSLETIARYMQERYPAAVGLKTEKSYV